MMMAMPSAMENAKSRPGNASLQHTTRRGVRDENMA
jgi:hypothetical protein